MEIEKKKLSYNSLIQTYAILGVVIILCIALTLTTKNFMTQTNIINVIRQVSINGILALGMTFVALTGGIDLSIGSLVAFSGVILAGLLRDRGAGIPTVIIASVIVSTILGSVNGYFVAYRKAPPFVVTLAMMTSARGMTYVASKGRPISPLPEKFLFLGKGSLFGLPIPAIIFFILFIIGFIILKYFRIGRYIYAVGGNENAAKVSGVNVKRVKLFVYMVSGFLCGFAAVILTARVSAGLPQAGESYELDAIAATVIGGTSLSGGRGRLWGTLIGTLLLGIVNNGLDLLNVTSYYQQIIKGLIILGAVLIDTKQDV